MPQDTVVSIETVTPAKASQPVHVLTIGVPTLIDGPELDEVRRQLDGLHAGHPRLDLLVDLGQVGMLSSPAIGLLGMEHRRSWGSKGRMKLCGIGPAVMKVLTCTRLDAYFDIHASRDEALASF